MHALVLAVADVDQDGVAAVQHVLHDPRRANALSGIALIEAELGVASADVEDADSAVHQSTTRSGIISTSAEGAACSCSSRLNSS